MTDCGARQRWRAGGLSTLAAIGGIVALASCKAEPRNHAAIDAYYRYDFTAAREALRSAAHAPTNNQTVLDNARLGLASLADGDLHEAETALGTSFDLLSSAGLNKDRTVAAVLDHEGVRIWKGEPFEQALTYHYVSLLYALRGDWENMRAAATNSLFRLTDFGRDQHAESLAQKAVEDEGYLERGYTAVDTDFALGFLMQAIGGDLAGASGAREQFNAALQINADLRPIVERLQVRDYDTLLIVDYGRGPMKQAYGTDQALARFVPRDEYRGQVIVSTEGEPLARANPVCDVNAMARDHRWNNLEDIRRAKSILGTALFAGGAVATAYGADREDAGVALAGVGAMALGLLTKSGARADTRYCEFMPRSIYLVPLTLERARDVDIGIAGRPMASMHLHRVQPGIAGTPRVIYLRLFPDGGGTDVSWLSARRELYSNDFTGVGEGRGAAPWILGGRDVSTPSREALEAYQRRGWCLDLTLDQLRNLYHAEGITLGSGMAIDANGPISSSYRHVLEGGTGLFTPHPYTMGYQRIMCARKPPYHPLTAQVRNAAARERVMPDVRADAVPGAAASTGPAFPSQEQIEP